MTVNVNLIAENVFFINYHYHKYSTSIIDDSVITCDKIIEETNAVTTNVNERNAVCKAKTLSYLPFY